MRKILSFLCLFVIGWGSAWADRSNRDFHEWFKYALNVLMEMVLMPQILRRSYYHAYSNRCILLMGTTVNYVSYNSNNILRFRVGTYFTISCEDGYKITGIQYNTLNNNRNFTAYYGSISGYSAGRCGGYDYTWSTTEDNVNSVTFTNNSTGNLDVTSIIVTYERNFLPLRS